MAQPHPPDFTLAALYQRRLMQKIQALSHRYDLLCTPLVSQCRTKSCCRPYEEDTAPLCFPEHVERNARDDGVIAHYTCEECARRWREEWPDRWLQEARQTERSNRIELLRIFTPLALCTLIGDGGGMRKTETQLRYGPPDGNQNARKHDWDSAAAKAERRALRALMRQAQGQLRAMRRETGNVTDTRTAHHNEAGGGRYA